MAIDSNPTLCGVKTTAVTGDINVDALGSYYIMTDTGAVLVPANIALAINATRSAASGISESDALALSVIGGL